ncbi:MAG: hypothetical protein ABIZ80_11780 [Bryobacteraceae bacterium]
MMLLPLTLTIAAISQVLLDDRVEVPRSEWRYVEVTVKDRAALVLSEFQVVSGDPNLRLLLIAHKDLEEFRAGNVDVALAASPFDRSGKMRRSIPAAGQYAIVVQSHKDNRNSTTVKLKVLLESAPVPREVPPAARRIIVLVSLSFLFGMCAYAGKRLVRPGKPT